MSKCFFLLKNSFYVKYSFFAARNYSQIDKFNKFQIEQQMKGYNSEPNGYFLGFKFMY